MLDKVYKIVQNAACVAIGLSLSFTALADSQPIIMSYWENWATYQNFPMPNNAQGSKNSVLTQQLAEINALAYAFFTVAEDGSLQFSDTWSDLDPNSEQDQRYCDNSPSSCLNFPQNAGLGNFDAFTKTSIKHHFISVGGGGNAKAFENALNHPEQFIRSLKTLLNTYNIDALDIDYEPEEGIPQAYIQRFIALTDQIKAEFPNLIVSYAINTITRNIENFGEDNWKKLSNNLNFISIMGYDMHGSFDSDSPYTALHSALLSDNSGPSIESTIKTLNKMGIPNSKIILGMPLYGRAVGGVKADGLGQLFTKAVKGDLDPAQCSTQLKAMNLCEGSFQYKTLVNQHYQPVEVKVGSQVTGVYVYDAEKGMFISYDNPDSAAAKTQYALKNQLAGVMFWSLDYDKPVDDPESILGAVIKILPSPQNST